MRIRGQEWVVRVQVLGKALRRGGLPSLEDKDVRRKLKHGARVSDGLRFAC